MQYLNVIGSRNKISGLALDIAGKAIWQQALGDGNRSYAEQCIRWDVILNGPGNDGPWPDSENVLRTKKFSSKKITDLRRFAADMKEGDIVVLRLGTDKVHAVGQVVGPYEWHEEFGDVDGWDLQHVRRVRWVWHDLSNPKDFGTYGLKQGDTTQRLNEGPVTK